jgi:hypothetical protein
MEMRVIGKWHASLGIGIGWLREEFNPDFRSSKWTIYFVNAGKELTDDLW